MWLHTKHGFVSVVQHRDDPDWRLVRARAKADLLSFVAESRVFHDADADYPWRAVLSSGELAEVMVRCSDEIDYPNFKSKVSTTLGAEREGLLHDVWETLTAIERIEESTDHYDRRFGYPGRSLGLWRDRFEAGDDDLIADTPNG